MSDMLENMTLNKKSTKLNLVVFCLYLFVMDFLEYWNFVHTLKVFLFYILQ